MRGCSSKAAATPWRRGSSSSGAKQERLSSTSCIGRLASPGGAGGNAPPPCHRRGALGRAAPISELMDLLDRAGPYGPGHPEPRFVFPAHRLSRVRDHQGGACPLHARIAPTARASRLAPSAWPTRQLGELLLKAEGLPLHVAGHLRRTSWQGRESVELMIEDAADAA